LSIVLHAPLAVVQRVGLYAVLQDVPFGVLRRAVGAGQSVVRFVAPHPAGGPLVPIGVLIPSRVRGIAQEKNIGKKKDAAADINKNLLALLYREYYGDTKSP
jgi:hypothetical protein